MGTFIDRDITGWRVSSGSKLSYTATFLRLNHKLLKWEWQPGSWIEYTIKDAFRQPEESVFGKAHPTFSFRALQEYERDSLLRFEFRYQDNISCFFEFNLKFSGWRTGWVSFWRDMVGRPGDCLDCVRIYAPEGNKNGNIYLDEIQPCTFIDPRLHMRDAQLPLVNSDTSRNSGCHWVGLYEFSLRQPPPEAPERPPAQVRADIRSIERYLTQHFVNQYKAMDTAAITPENIMADLGLKRKTGRLAGPPPIYEPALDIYPARIRAKYRRLLTYCRIEKYFENLFRIAGKIRYGENNDASRQMELFGLELMQFLRFHGWNEGSGQGTLRYFGFALQPLAPALLLMRDFLARNGELDHWRRILRWFAGTGRIYGVNATPAGENVDILTSETVSILISILLDAQEATQRRDLDCFSQWLNHALTPAPGLADWIKPDGALFHHGNHYPSHGIAALEHLLPVIYALTQTEFDLTEPAWHSLARAGLRVRWYANPLELPMSMAGSSTSGYCRINPDLFYDLSMIARKRGDEPTADTAADTFIRLTETEPPLGERNTERKLMLKMGAAEALPPEGHLTMNYAAAGIHRRHDWLATVRGHSRYLWRSEILPTANLYGRYQTFGQLEILPADRARLSFQPGGWDWNRWPGTTVPVKPLRALHADLHQLDDFTGFAEMLLSPEAFAGGCSLAEAYGVFSMLLRGHPKYEQTFVARKSWFFDDDFIVCLGSGISHDDRGCPVQTNLFQTPLQEGAAAGINLPMMNGGHLNAARIDSCGSCGTWISDTCGNGYYLPSGEFTVTFGRQTSRSWDDTAETEGHFASAWFDHGVCPQNAGYEYVVLPQGVEQTADFALSMLGGNRPYEVLRHDLAVHAVKFRQSGICSLVMFNAGLTGILGPVTAVDKPAVLLYRRESAKLRLALCNPDLALYQGEDPDQFDEQGNLRELSVYSRPWRNHPSRSTPVRLEMAGAWKLVEPHPACRGIAHSKVRTVLEFTTADAIPVEITLREG